MTFFKKMFHRCRPELVAINDDYHTSFTDISKNVYHQMRFYRCDCSKRSFKTDYARTYDKHAGIEKARQNWLETGVVPKNSYHPSKSHNYVKIDDVEREKLDPILAYQKTLEDIQQSLKVVITRDFNLELQYPALKRAADEYQRQLDKYRMFEALKDKNNE
jgi:hypothetical protein